MYVSEMTERRVLVAYGTRNGSTAGIAATIADALREDGLTVDVAPADTIRSVADYAAVVLGGALYTGRWHKDARRLARRQAKALRDRPVWLFSSGPLDDSADERDIPAVETVQSEVDGLHARGHATFGGMLDETADGFVAHAMVRNGHGGDFRSPERIRTWAHEIATRLRTEE